LNLANAVSIVVYEGLRNIKGWDLDNQTERVRCKSLPLFCLKGIKVDIIGVGKNHSTVIN
jgi:hypothetical protein